MSNIQQLWRVTLLTTNTFTAPTTASWTCLMFEWQVPVEHWVTCSRYRVLLDNCSAASVIYRNYFILRNSFTDVQQVVLTFQIVIVVFISWNLTESLNADLHLVHYYRTELTAYWKSSFICVKQDPPASGLTRWLQKMASHRPLAPFGSYKVNICRHLIRFRVFCAQYSLMMTRFNSIS